jgi:hypothetical protein
MGKRGYAPTPLLDRISTKYEIDEETGCWLWTASLDSHGYGQIGSGGSGGKLLRAHRAVWLETVGPLEDGEILDHLCSVRRCINPDHLEPVSLGENNRRGNGWGGRNAKKSHCPQGHEFTEHNTYKYGTTRQCRECARAYDRRRRPAKGLRRGRG